MKAIRLNRMIMTLLATVLTFSLAEADQTPKHGINTKPHPLPKDVEIQLALSSLPNHLRDQSTVYVLNPERGFEVTRKGSNGFHAFVARTGDDALRGDWPLDQYRDDILYPVAFDEIGAKAQMQIMFDVAQMQAKGTPASELKSIFRQRTKQGHYPVPHRTGVSYMLSPILRTYAEPDKSDRVVTVSFPHVMYYAPHVENHHIGGGNVGELKVRVNLPGPHGYINQPIGLAEREKIQTDHRDLLQALCGIKQVWCLSR